MNGTIIEEMSHLSCWFPGTLVLTLVYVPDALVDAGLVQQLMRACFDFYKKSPLGLAPEVVI